MMPTFAHHVGKIIMFILSTSLSWERTYQWRNQRIKNLGEGSPYCGLHWPECLVIPSEGMNICIQKKKNLLLLLWETKAWFSTANGTVAIAMPWECHAMVGTLLLVQQHHWIPTLPSWLRSGRTFLWKLFMDLWSLWLFKVGRNPEVALEPRIHQPSYPKDASRYRIDLSPRHDHRCCGFLSSWCFIYCFY